MFKITQGAEVIGLCDKPRYVKSKEGVYIEATEEEATHVAVQGVAYPLSEVAITQVDSGVVAFNQSNEISATNNSIDALTPYTETKTAYIGDKEMLFYDVPDGNVTVFYDKPYELKRFSNRIELSFDPIEDITDITISIL